MISFKTFLIEYELTSDVIPSHKNEDDIDHDEFKKSEIGNIDNHRVVQYKSKSRGSHFTFITKDNKTLGSIEHKPTKTAKNGRLAISNITKIKGSDFSMGNVLHHLIHRGHDLESDNTNTESGAHRMLLNLAKRPDINTHIEDGYGDKISHTGDISSQENQKKYSIKSSDPNFLKYGHDIHKHVLVFSKKDT